MAQGGTAVSPNTDDDQHSVIHCTSGGRKTIVQAGRVCHLVSRVDRQPVGGPTDRKTTVGRHSHDVHRILLERLNALSVRAACGTHGVFKQATWKTQPQTEI